MLYKLLQGIVNANKKLLIFFMNNKLIPKPDKKVDHCRSAAYQYYSWILLQKFFKKILANKL